MIDRFLLRFFGRIDDALEWVEGLFAPKCKCKRKKK